jgi:sulfur carrier protein
MKITVNGENHTLTGPTSLKQLVSELDLENKRLAIEVNQDIVPRGEYADFLLKDNDKVEIVHAIGGG